MAPLFTHARIERYAAAMAECAGHAIAGLREGERLDVSRLTTHIAMRIAGKTLFDIDTLDEADELGAALTVTLDWASDMSVSPLYTAQVWAVGTLQVLADKSLRSAARRARRCSSPALAAARALAKRRAASRPRSR